MPDSLDYLHTVDPAHIASSTEVLNELSDLLSMPLPPGGGEQQLIQIGCIDHGGFFSEGLRGFPMKQVSPRGEVGGTNDGPDELLLAVVINHKLDDQIRTVLESVVNLLRRRELIGFAISNDGDTSKIEAAASMADRQAASDLDDQLRRADWRTIARQVRERATAGGTSLRVQFKSPLLDQSELRGRVPALRRTYNEFPIARDAIDRVAAAVSQGLSVEGDRTPESMMQHARQILDSNQVGAWTAHLLRDAFVCGNGYLDMRTPLAGLRLLRPEEVDYNPDGTLLIPERGSKQRITTPPTAILHTPAIRQPGSELGVSALEPFLTMQLQQDVVDSAVQEIADAIAQFKPSPQELAGFKDLQAAAARIRQSNARRATNILGSGPMSLPDPPASLYFPDQVAMTHASPPLFSSERH